MTRREQVLDFWFDQANKRYWFEKSDDFDAAVEARLKPLYEQARNGELHAWADSPKGALALCILLDQVPRNLFRNSAKAYASDDQARGLSHQAIERGFDQALGEEERLFLYLPLEHSEDLEDQNLCCQLMATLESNPEWLGYAEKHRDIVQRFGRFPHRNAALGRSSSEEEAAFLKEPGSSF